MSNTNVTLRQLRAFQQVYRLRNLTHAAEAMHLTQSAMSVLIRQLEEALGVQLFERVPRTLRPMSVGNQAAATVDQILALVDKLGDDMRKHSAAAGSQLAFISTPAWTSTVIPQVLTEFRQKMPNVRVVMHDSVDKGLVDEVLSEQVEFAVGFFNDPEALSLRPLLHDHLHVCCHLDSRLASLPRVTWADVAQEPLIQLSRLLPMHHQVASALAMAGATYKPAYEVTFLPTALALVRERLGVAVLPGYLMQADQQHGHMLVARQLFEPTIERNLYVHTRHGHQLSEPAELFLSMLRQRLSHSASKANGLMAA
jgi:DNA-binding transcriptional LysR family regulator